jgi:hypothetical protein
MGHRELRIGTLNGRRAPDFVAPVMLWDGYGAVAPMLWVTNGSIRFLARQMMESVAAGHYEWRPEHLGIPGWPTTEDELRDAIKRVYDRWMEWQG